MGKAMKIDCPKNSDTIYQCTYDIRIEEYIEEQGNLFFATINLLDSFTCFGMNGV